MPGRVVQVASLWPNRQAIRKAEAKHKQVVAHERLLATEMALRSYQFEHGGPPAKLEDMVTNFLAKLPQDPFGACPLTFRSQGTNWLLYSIGSDGVDDGGQAVGSGLPGKGDILVDSSW